MPAETLDQTLDDIRDLNNVHRVTAANNGELVRVYAAINYDKGDLCPVSEALFVDIDERLAPFGLVQMYCEVDDSDPGDREAVEVWIFVRA